MSAKGKDTEVVTAFKGFDKDFKCRGYQFKVGETFVHDGNVKACESGFHACENPVDVWGYYGPGCSRYALVEMSGEMQRHEGDSKIAAAKIHIKAELSLPDYIGRVVDAILKAVDWNNKKESNTGYQSAATNTGYQSAATNTGYRSAATNTGYYSAATNTGNQSAATNTGYRSAATNTGDYSAATNTGDYSAATNTGKEGVALASGYEGRVSGANGCALFLVERDTEYRIMHVWAGIAGKDGIKPETFYMLKNGKPVEV